MPDDEIGQPTFDRSRPSRVPAPGRHAVQHDVLRPTFKTKYVQDLHRPDGSVFFRRPVGPTAQKNPMSPYLLVDTDGKIVASWPRNKGLHRFWLRQLATDAERIFIISDSRFALRTVVPIADRRFHVLHLMHNVHLVGTRLWNATLSPDYAPLLNSIADIDGLVTLTDRQRTDVAAAVRPDQQSLRRPESRRTTDTARTPPGTGPDEDHCRLSVWRHRRNSRTRSPRSRWCSTKSRTLASTSTARDPTRPSLRNSSRN